MPATAPLAPRISASHQVNRYNVVDDIVTFLLQHFAAVGTYVETVEAANDFAHGLGDAEWAALGTLTGHYRHGDGPDQDTVHEVLLRLERLLPAAPAAADEDPFAGIGGF